MPFGDYREILDYYNTYGFERDTEDTRYALLIHTLRMVHGDKKSEMANYLPSYRKEPKSEKSIEKQTQEAKDFRNRLTGVVN